ncbi:MAG: type II toxin-antitoxin system HicB family antitoxin [Gemmatimonadetes bacterium]|nr:type II toxin-antitoxin system HicB family antitoxin [Gemmatimonadota bacterium]MYB55227.1 type II toxin-antitoxin system HicB family antitoxin [Gemmatimonadota bacterium]
MLTTYIQSAMKHAKYEILDDQTFYGEIEGFQGVYANANTLEMCREELQSVLEGWIILGLRMGHPLPEVNGVRLDAVLESV